MINASKVKNKKEQYNIHLSNGLSINDISKEQYDMVLAKKEENVDGHVYVSNVVDQKDVIIHSKFLVTLKEISAIEAVEVTKPVIMKL